MIGDRKEDRRTRSISFRLTEDEYQKIETAALMNGENANDWCRNLSLAQATQGHGFTRNEQLIFHEIAKLRYLFGNYVALINLQQLNKETWKEIRERSELYLREMVADLIRAYDPRDPYAEAKKENTVDGLPPAKTFGPAKQQQEGDG